MNPMKALKTGVVLLLFSAIATLLGYLIARIPGALVFFGMSLVIHALFIVFAKALILHVAHAVKAPKEKFKALYETITDISSHMNIGMPSVYIAPSPQPNAFVIGKSSSSFSIVVTRGLLEMEDDKQVIAIITLALSLSKQGLLWETIITSYAATITRVAQMGQFSILKPARRREKGNSLSALLFFILAPIASFCIKFASAKDKYFISDFDAATVLREPQILADGLEHIKEAVKEDIPLINPNPSLAHLYVIHPFHNKTLKSLFNTHPSTSTRISKLRNMTV